MRWMQSVVYDVNRNVCGGRKDYGIIRLQFDIAHIAGNLWWLTRWTLGLGFSACCWAWCSCAGPLTRWMGGLERLRDAVQTMGTDAAHPKRWTSPTRLPKYRVWLTWSTAPRNWCRSAK